jgi:hypothetical protein
MHAARVQLSHCYTLLQAFCAPCAQHVELVDVNVHRNAASIILGCQPRMTPSGVPHMRERNLCTWQQGTGCSRSQVRCCCRYWSFVTLTTIGYGDFVPKRQKVRELTGVHGQVLTGVHGHLSLPTEVCHCCCAPGPGPDSVIDPSL